MLIGHSYIFPCEVWIQEFCQFLTGLSLLLIILIWFELNYLYTYRMFMCFFHLSKEGNHCQSGYSSSNRLSKVSIPLFQSFTPKPEPRQVLLPSESDNHLQMLHMVSLITQILHYVALYIFTVLWLNHFLPTVVLICLFKDKKKIPVRI